MRNPFSLLRLVAVLEALSFLLLLGVAMPLKYVWGHAMAVRLAGSVHGGLFLLYVWALGRVWLQAAWPVSRAAAYFVASLIPFAPFFLDGRLKHAAQAWDAASPAAEPPSGLSGEAL